MSVSVRPQRARRGHRALSAVLLSAGLIVAVSQAARAQGYGEAFFEDDVLPPRVIAWRLADRGFTDVSRPRFDGRFYHVDAISPAGLPVRLVLDAANGGIVGRERGAGPEVVARLERPPVRSMPGYGWTEDDVARSAEPAPSAPGLAPRQQRRAALEPARPVETNPLGLNPGAAGRTEAPRKVARPGPARPVEKPVAKVSPEAPAPKAASEAPPSPPTSTTPAANTNPTPDAASPPKPAAEPKPVAAATSKPDWKDPPAEGKRNVRVIGGATIVPGTSEKPAEPQQ